MTTDQNIKWNLEPFIDSLAVELDKARETLAVKSINKKITYSVKDISLDLNLFPTFDGDRVQFVTASPGQTGSSKLSIQFSSITDQQIRQTSKRPITKEDISIETVDVDKETKKELRKMGVSSVEDLKELEDKNVDIEKISSKKLNYKKLADIINKSKRGDQPPKVSKVSLSQSAGSPTILVKGKNLSLDKSFEPVAAIDSQLAKVISYSEDHIELETKPGQLSKGKKSLVVTLDPYAIFKLEINKED